MRLYGPKKPITKRHMGTPSIEKSEVEELHGIAQPWIPRGQATVNFLAKH
jgi:hypothetical protein